MGNTLKAVIIDEKENRINQIKSFLPDYIDFGVASYGDAAKAEIIGSNDGKKCNVVIMYGDDIKGHSVYMFDWLKNSGAVPGIEYIPVVVITKDEFSDRSLEILEIGDCFFYEGEIEDDDFYSVVMEAIDSFDDELIEDDSLIAEVKNPEKIMGMSYVLPADSLVPQRAMVLSDDEMIKGIQSSIETGKKETIELREILTQTYEEAKENGEELSWAPKTKEERSTPKVITFNEPEEPLEVRKKKYLHAGVASDNEYIKQSDDDDELYIRATLNDIHAFNDKTRIVNLVAELSRDIDNMQQQVNPMAQGGVYGAQGMGMQMMNNQMSQNIIRNATSNGPKKILVIDPDEQTVGAVKSIVGDTCVVENVDSPMKAIDYFISGYADLVVIEYNLKSMTALQVIQSIKMQAGGQHVKIIVTLSTDEMQYYQTVAASPHISGIVGKPIMRNQLETLIQSIIR